MAYRPSARQLEYFIALAESGHFGRAAQRCHVSQPTLSAQFKLLEDQLGVSLVDRARGSIVLTPTGEALLSIARQALENLDEIVSVATARKAGLGGLVRLGVAPTFGSYFMPHLLPSLKAAYPSLDIYIREERPARLGQDLQKAALDCILVSAPLDADNTMTQKVCTEDLSIGVPADHALSGASPVRIEALRGERFLTLGPGYQLYQAGQALCQASGAHLLEDYEGTSLDAIRQMVSIGMGLALFPAAYIASEFHKEERVRLLKIEGPPLRREIVMAWRRNSPRSGHFAIVADLARETVRRMNIPGLEAAD
ncbi:hyaluronan synthase [Roseibium aquae]|uniref:Hyaluronan synthase n=1 Tax=Roseibium aquae TaxID=1323746 RepID=A0A916TFQ5_9HYPH|nr:hydrogen peroxide-inducible genes activator [Roseibium aquae]GGB43358.1 hyaluronan synthase [Roseibium aquae]